jgi:hypothetical protein
MLLPQCARKIALMTPQQAAKEYGFEQQAAAALVKRATGAAHGCMSHHHHHHHHHHFQLRPHE